MTEEQLFKEWITENWQEKYHNFSKLENGNYYYSGMQDAWEIWIGCVSTHSVFNKIKRKIFDDKE